jgi:hypothetical protein
MWRSVSTEFQGWRQALSDPTCWAEVAWRVGMAACSAAGALLAWGWWHEAWLSVLVPVLVVLLVALARLRLTGRP